jgi:hypothetical protein
VYRPLGPSLRPLAFPSSFIRPDSIPIWLRDALVEMSEIADLQVRIILVGQRHGRSIIHLLLVLLHQLRVDLNFRRSQSGRSNELELRIADQLAGQPEEGLLEVVVGLCGNVVVLKVLLAVEGDGLGLDFSLLHVDLVPAQNDGDILADADEITCYAVSGGVIVGCS